jgi:transcriptional regulator with XRE-family HTH domain
MRIKNYIRQMREKRGMSQEALAERLNTFNQQISHLELGKRRLTWEWMVRISEVLECHPLDLVDHPSPSVAREERHLLDAYRALTPSQRDTIVKMATTLAESKIAGVRKPPASKKPKKRNNA